LAGSPDSPLFAAVPFPAFAVNAQGEVLAWNAAAERAYGWPRADVLGRPPPPFPGRALDALRDAARRVLSSHRGEAIDLACTPRAGASRPVRLTAASVDDLPGAVLLVEGAAPAPDDESAPRARQLQAVLDAIPAPIFFKDVRGAYLGCNAAFERYLGTSRERLVGKTVFDIAPPDLAPVYHRADEALFASGGPQVYETGVQWADGKRREVIFHKAAITDAAGHVTGLAGAMLDVTEQRAAERGLRDRLLQQAALTMIMTQVLKEQDPARLVEAALQLTVDAQGAVAGSVLELANEEGRWTVRQAAGAGPAEVRPLEEDALARRLIETGHPLVTADGAALGLPVPPSLAGETTFSAAAVLVGGHDAPRGVLAVYDRPARLFTSDDVQTLEIVAHVLAVGLGRSSALDAVRSTEASFRLLVESVPDLVVIHERGRIAYANPAMQRLLARPLDEIVGSLTLDWIHPDDRAAVLPALEGAAPMPPVELRMRSGDGGWLTAEFLSIGVEMSGRQVRIAIGRDLTERRQAKDRLARAQRLAAIGTLAAGVAHELNNPLTFVLSNVEHVATALRRLRGAPADADGWNESLHALDDALEGSQRMRSIVSDLQTMARADDDASPEPADVRRLLETAAHLAWNDVRSRARLVWDIGPVPPVRGSESRLGQVFLNLIVNAAHAIPEGHPGAHIIRLSASARPDGKVAISVSDTGAGIPPENLSRIFDPFFTTKPAGLGTGLGLWVCHNIVSAYGGSLDVSSEVGRGTTFRVILLSADPAEAAPRPRGESAGAARPLRRLLVVDDEPLVAATVRRQLSTDFVVDAASGTADALARIALGRYDAVVCDVLMEGANGLQFLDALRLQVPELAGRVLFVTGGATSACMDVLAGCGVPCLPKPFDGRQLRQALRELLATAA